MLESKEMMILKHGSKPMTVGSTSREQRQVPQLNRLSPAPAALVLSYWTVCCWTDCCQAQAFLPKVTVTLEAEQPFKTGNLGKTGMKSQIW